MLGTLRARRKPLSGLVLLIMIALVAAFLPGATPRAQAQAGDPSVPEAAGVSFNSSFNSNHNGWSPIAGTWTLGGGYYQGPGVKGKWGSIARTGTYTTLDYKVKMRRTGCKACANAVIVRGQPSPLGASRLWDSGYYFIYSRDGWTEVFKKVGGTYTGIQDWAPDAAVITGAKWNVLHVVASGDSLSFYINDTPVWSGTDSELGEGRVGVSLYRTPGSANNLLQVDWATMAITLDPNPFADAFASTSSGGDTLPDELGVHP